MTFDATSIWIWRTIRHKIDAQGIANMFITSIVYDWSGEKKEKTLNKHVFKKTHFHSIQRDIFKIEIIERMTYEI
jgi:hypothetical protein